VPFIPFYLSTASSRTTNPMGSVIGTRKLFHDKYVVTILRILDRHSGSRMNV
jgi:hypothetical protein